MSDALNRQPRATFSWRLPVYGLAALWLAVAVPRLCFPDLDRGDEFSDANVLEAGRNFARLGFVATQFLPRFDPQATPESPAYTHYPPGPDLLNGAVVKLTGAEELLVFRALALLLSALAVAAWYGWLWRLTRVPGVALAGAAIYLCHPVFTRFADSLHQMPLSEAVRGLFLWVALGEVAGAGADRRSRCRRLAGLGGLALLGSWTSFEYIPYFALLVALLGGWRVRLGAERWGQVVGEVAVVTAASTIGVLVHLGQNVWHFGSLAVALGDLLGAASENSGGAGTAAVGGEVLTVGVWFGEVLLTNLRLALAMPLSAAGGLLLATLLLRRRAAKRGQADGVAERLLVAAAIFALCGVVWWGLFPGHALHHRKLVFLARHFLPAAICLGLAFGRLALPALAGWWPRLGQPLAAGRLAGLVVAGVCGWLYFASDLPVTPVRIRAAADFAGCRAALELLANWRQPGQRVGINVWRTPMYRYYLRAECEVVAHPQQLEAEDLPEWFVLMPAAANAILFQDFLNTHYVSMGQADSWRFPIYICRRRDLPPPSPFAASKLEN